MADPYLGQINMFGGNFAPRSYALCQGQLLPPLDFENALRPWHGLGVDYEGGVLATDARVTIHLMHRVGAVLVLIYLGALSWWLIQGNHDRRVKTAGVVLALALLAQVALGIGNVVLGLPLLVAVAHNGVAALLLLTLITVYHVVRPPRSAV